MYVFMKKYLVLLSAVLFMLPLQAQVVQTSKLNMLLAQSRKDSLQKTERLAALKFHHIINNYRKENKIDTLVWDDTLWVAARNHSIWMGNNNELSHTEKEGTPDYTGRDPGDRYNYASANNGSCNWSGENALYSWSSMGSTINEISDDMAQDAFTLWKNSPGHDENMRAPLSKVHAVAFYISPRGSVWATDLFAYQPTYMPYLAASKKTVEKSVADEVAEVSVQKKPAARKMSVIAIEQAKDSLLAVLEKGNTEKLPLGRMLINKAMKKAAMRHALYMANSKKITHTERKDKPGFYAETEKKRVMKASWGLYFFYQRKMPLTESIALTETENSNLNIPRLGAEVESALDKERMAEGSSGQAGYGLAIKQVKDKLKVYAVRLEEANDNLSARTALSDK